LIWHRLQGRAVGHIGFLKDAAHWNFKIFKFKDGSTAKIKQYNQNLWDSLLCNDAFHHKVYN